ncbi:MAG TPA: rhamnulokinase family protein [Pseudonocardiaceae bacterium]|jgi:rhamnulokinase|nr:rhamnulokinase family protein [Pseudonocardiaceae bacterium]
MALMALMAEEGTGQCFAAVDLGASSGRVMLGRVGPDRVELTEAHRFANRPVRVAGTLYWDILALYQGVLDGLRAAAAAADGRLAGIGVDSWAVDYGLLDHDGVLLRNPVHYRDDRTEAAVARTLAKVSAQRLYAATGIQFQPFNTLFQLVADGRAQARTALLIPDLICYWLTGNLGTEVTNASTTGLLAAGTGDWATDIAEAAGIDLGLFPPLRQPGELLGPLRPEVSADLGLTQPAPVFAVGSHDTASAVVGVPAETERFAYISSGTWSLVGVELGEPVLDEASRTANFTNECGVDGRIRFLRNVMGLWLVQECLRDWGNPELSALLTEAAEIPGGRSVIDATDARFLAPGGMPARIAAACREAGQPEPSNPAEFLRCVTDSLAIAYRDAVADAVRLSGRAVDVVHIVGGGANNALLCQLTADACGLPVIAGPAEATALGNVLVQARAAGVLDGGLEELRALLRRTRQLRVFR